MRSVGKLLTVIGATAVTTAVAVYTAIELHRRRERHFRIKAIIDESNINDDIEETPESGNDVESAKDKSNEVTSSDDKSAYDNKACEHCDNVDCPCFGVEDTNCKTDDEPKEGKSETVNNSDSYDYDGFDEHECNDESKSGLCYSDNDNSAQEFNDEDYDEDPFEDYDEEFVDTYSEHDSRDEDFFEGADLEDFEDTYDTYSEHDSRDKDE